MKIAAVSLIVTCILSAGVEAQVVPPLTDEMLKQASAVLHVDEKTGRLAGYTKPVEGEYVKPVVSQRLLIFSREGRRGPLVDADFSPQARDALVQRFTEYRRKGELLTAEMHVPDYLLRSAQAKK